VRRLVGLLPSYLDGSAYNATVTAPPGGALQFFDDNEWLALDLVDASHLLGDPSLRRRAQRVFDWITSGWDGGSGNACSGGVYWANTPSIRDRNTVSTANGAVLALELYRDTRNPAYLTWGRRMYAWVRSCLADDDGLLFDHLDSEGRIDQSKWTYNQGAMVAAAALLYRATGSSVYLRDATSLANQSLQYFDASSYGGQPAIFVAIYFRYLRVLDSAAPQPQIAAALSRYVATHEASAPGSGSDVLDRAAAVQLAAGLARR
jgi:predicted alpha-1,6-mannanase (GH76 family)